MLVCEFSTVCCQSVRIRATLDAGILIREEFMTKKTLFIGRTPVGGFDESSEPDVCFVCQSSFPVPGPIRSASERLSGCFESETS